MIPAYHSLYSFLKQFPLQAGSTLLTFFFHKTSYIACEQLDSWEAGNGVRHND